MNEIKAFIHRTRAADVIHALKEAGYINLSVVDVRGMLRALNAGEKEYSIALGEEAITEVKLEVFCQDEAATTAAVDIIRRQGRTGQPDAGWVFVSEVRGIPIEG